jgi:hypothetical protein
MSRLSGSIMIGPRALSYSFTHTSAANITIAAAAQARAKTATADGRTGAARPCAP